MTEPRPWTVVDDVEDPEVAPFAGVRERDLVRGNGGVPSFVAEGEVVVRVLARAGRFRVRSLFLEERRVPALADVARALPPETKLLVAKQAVMDQVVGFHIHRGVLALGERGPDLDAATLLRTGQGPVLGLVGLANHDNMGGIFRNAAAFGVRAVLLDQEACDPLYRKAIRVSVGGALIVPFARVASADAMLALLEREGFDALALTPRGRERLDRLAPGRPRALVLGTEGRGLPDDVIARARGVQIAMAPGLDSLNVAVTSGIALYELTKSPS